MKKGFTLLELLAVIVVLAIIALIVTPFVTEAIENSRKGAFKSSVYGLKDAAELYCGQELTKNGGVFNGETFTVSNGELVSTTNPNNKLKFKGSSPVGESSVTISDDCQVTLNVTNGTYFASLEPGEVDVTITEEELASREELANEIASLTARLNSLDTRMQSAETKNNSQDEEIININSVPNIFLKSHAIGSIYTTIATDENTAIKMHNKYGGTWQAYAEGKVLIGVGTGNDETESKTFNINTTGGKYNHTLTIAQMPSHRHNYGVGNNGSGNFSGWVINNAVAANLTNTNVLQTAYTGSTQPHNNIQPYVTVYMWQRTA